MSLHDFGIRSRFSVTKAGDAIHPHFESMRVTRAGTSASNFLC